MSQLTLVADCRVLPDTDVIMCCINIMHIIIHAHGQRKERNILFNDALNTFLFTFYGVGHMVKEYSESGRENSLSPRES